jgi:hypothetical protein
MNVIGQLPRQVSRQFCPGPLSGAGRPVNPSTTFSRFRLLNTTTRRTAQYERFGFENARNSIPPGGSSPGGGGRRPGGNQHPLILALRRRLGDRGIVLYGVGLAGCGVYYVAHLERVPETGRLRFIDVSPEKEKVMGLQAQQETLSQYQGALLSPSHPTSKRVREIARRIVEGNMLGHMKEDHSITNISNISLGSIFGGNSDEGLFGDGNSESREPLNAAGNRDVEWEVRIPYCQSPSNESLTSFATGIRDQGRQGQERFRVAW